MPEDDANHEDSQDTVASSSAVSLETRKRTKHVELIDQILQALDVLTFVQLSAAYLADCLTLLLVIRTLVQIFVCSPRTNAGLPELHPQRAHLSLIAGTGVVALLLHLLRDAPAAGEASRYYQNGGIFVDFVGQLTPISKWRLVFFDSLIFFLQTVMLTATIARERIKNPTSTLSVAAQDHDAEERAVTTSDNPATSDVEEGMEMVSLLAEQPEDSSMTRHPLDGFYTGNVMVLELNLVQDIKRHLALEPPTVMTPSIDPERFRSLVRSLLGPRFRTPST